jgi:hypothetical protein
MADEEKPVNEYLQRDYATLDPDARRIQRRAFKAGYDYCASLVVPPRPTFPDLAALESLRDRQQQLDEDGTMVGVSRQALVEVLAFIDSITKESS